MADLQAHELQAQSETEKKNPCIGIVTISDRAHSGVYTDRGGPSIISYISSNFLNNPTTKSIIIPDNFMSITETLKSFSKTCDLILTTGGTGPAVSDVTPEATVAVCDKELKGFGERMRGVSVDKVPTAILSRATAGVCGKCVVINLPGSPKAVKECLDGVIQAVPHAVRLVGGQKLELKEDAGRQISIKHKTGEDGVCEGCREKH